VPAPDDAFWHVPLLCVGDPKGNGMLVRLSACHTCPHVLWVTARPLDLADAHALAGGLSMPGAVTRLLMRATRGHQRGRTVDNLVDLVQRLQDPELDAETGVARGYQELVEQRVYDVHIENVRRVAVAGGAEMVLPGDFSTTSRGTLAGTVADFVRTNAGVVRHVVFAGFSLGAGTSLCLAHAVARALRKPAAEGAAAKRPKVPRLTCVQLAGTRVGGARLRRALKTAGVRVLYAALEDSRQEGLARFDPVTYMPYAGAGRQHIFNKYYVVDLGDRSVREASGPRPHVQRQLAAYTLAIPRLAAGFIAGLDLGGGYAGFVRTHLEGEARIAPIVAEHLVQTGRYQGAFLSHACPA
jgi:hypothetical protein